MTFDGGGRACPKHGGVVRDLSPVAARKAVAPVRRPFGVGECFEGDWPGFEELLHVYVRALPDDGDPDVVLHEFLVTVAQLRDVPAAERSAVVAKENEGEWPIRPQFRKTDLGTVQSENLGIGRALTNLRMHAAERTGTKAAQRNRVRTATL